MKSDIHPRYFSEAKVTCVCGNVFTVGSTAEKISVEICSSCHPFYSGEEKIIDTAGRVEKFKARFAAAKDRADKRAEFLKKKAEVPKPKEKKSKKKTA